MKAILLAICIAFALQVSAQGPPCEIDSQYTEPGFYPVPDSLPCFNGDYEWNDITIQFVNFDSATVSGIGIRMEYLIIDSIINLPCGIRWTTSAYDADTAHRFENQEKGCIRFYGTTDEPSGQYKLEIKVKAKVSLLPDEVPYDAEALGFRVDVRLKDNVASTTCPPNDTTAGATLLTASCRTAPPPPDPPQGINSVANINHFTFYPNPTNNTASVSFTAREAATYSVRIINIYGQEVSRELLNVTAGANTHQIDVAHLANGVYIYTITDGKNVQTQRFVVGQ